MLRTNITIITIKDPLLIRYKLKHAERKYYNDYNKGSLLTKYKVYI